MMRNNQKINDLSLDAPFQRRLAWQSLYQDHGPALNLLWVHGFRSSMEGQKVGSLKLYCQRKNLGLILFDLTAHGRSSGQLEDCSISLWLADLMAVLKQTSGPLVLVASSMGGWLSLLALDQMRKEEDPHLDWVKGLVLIAPAIDMTKRLIEDKFTKVERKQLKKHGVIYQTSHYDGEAFPITNSFIKDGKQYLLKDKKYQLTCPLRILHGMQDVDVPYGLSVKFMKKIRPKTADAHLTLIKDGGHRLSRPADLALLTAKIDELKELALMS